MQKIKLFRKVLCKRNYSSGLYGITRVEIPYFPKKEKSVTKPKLEDLENRFKKISSLPLDSIHKKESQMDELEAVLSDGQVSHYQMKLISFKKRRINIQDLHLINQNVQSVGVILGSKDCTKQCKLNYNKSPPDLWDEIFTTTSMIFLFGVFL